VIVKEGKEIKEAEEVKERKAKTAAFFDLDGTLVAGPSLERRFFRELRYRRVIGWKNYLWWMAQALRLAPRGITEIVQGNKMYLRGVAVAPNKSNPGERRKCAFFAAAIKRITWHAERGDTIVIVSGTLEFLAREAARELELILSRCGIAAKVQVCATRLEEKDGCWAGKIIGEALFGGAKAREVRRLAAQMGFDLKRSYAYGDSAQDRWLLEAVGNPWVVNPAPGLSRVARNYNWPIVWWKEGKELTQRVRRTHRIQRRAEAMARLGAWDE
jgi:HAD superfamily hydrolase (TIGR01490 family)